MILPKVFIGQHWSPVQINMAKNTHNLEISKAWSAQDGFEAGSQQEYGF